MNKYRDKSDFEINKAVAEYKYGTDAVVEKFGIIYISDSDAMVSFSPCNNPYDSMPVIIDNGISSMFNGDEWICSASNGEFLSVNENLYRAAMEVFLMMKDAENES